MCYSIAFIETSPKKYAENYSQILQKELTTPKVTSFTLYFYVSGFQFPVLPIVMYNKVDFSNWGLIPYWTKDQKKANEIRSKTLNAVGETIFEKPSYKKAIYSQRCVLGIQGFYEWRTYHEKKYPYFIYSSKSTLLSLGCIYDYWIEKETGHIFNSFSIVTTPANSIMEKIHNTKKRMPLILTEDKVDLWLNEKTSISVIQSLIKPYPDNLLSAHTISTFISKHKENKNIPEIQKPFHYPQLAD